MERIRSILKDSSTSALVAGFIVVLVGISSSAALLFQAALSIGVPLHETGSWLGSLCITIGILSIIFSLRYREPVLFAWSTPGTALLLTSAGSLSLQSATGAFLFCAALIFLMGVTGFFEKIMSKIPNSLSSALLAGVLFHFCVDAIFTIQKEKILVSLMFFAYLFGRKFSPRYTMLFILGVGGMTSLALHLLKMDQFQFAFTTFYFNKPHFELSSILNLGIPLFIVTMASQNLAGLSVMRANGFNTPLSPLLTWSGFFNFFAAPFGAFTINLAAITAALSMSSEAHPDKNKRYISSAFAGFLYIFVGFFATTITTLLSSFPKEMIVALTGFALISTVSSNLEKCFSFPEEKESAFLTFLIAASPFSLFGISSSFWSIVIGLLSSILFKPSFFKKKI